jgi:hypothetical protein
MDDGTCQTSSAPQTCCEDHETSTGSGMAGTAMNTNAMHEMRSELEEARWPESGRMPATVRTESGG